MLAAPRAAQDLPSDVSARFTTAHRLLRKTGYGHVLHANLLSSVQYKVFFDRNGKGNARLGIIVGKKTLPRATCRNRLKRIVREVFRQHSIKLCGLDLVVMLRRANSRENEGAAEELNRLFSLVEKRCAE